MEQLSYELRELTDTELDEVAGGTGDGDALINVERNTVFAPITVVVLLYRQPTPPGPGSREGPVFLQ